MIPRDRMCGHPAIDEGKPSTGRQDSVAVGNTNQTIQSTTRQGYSFPRQRQSAAPQSLIIAAAAGLLLL